MDWNCSECSYANSSEDRICVMCEQGYRFFSVNSNQNDSQNMDNNVDSNDEDSVITLNDENEARELENLSSATDETESDEDDSLLGRMIDN